jgi:hypothetical protein
MAQVYSINDRKNNADFSVLIIHTFEAHLEAYDGSGYGIKHWYRRLPCFNSCSSSAIDWLLTFKP